jgi:cytochrome c oxidase cbb3-type subunit 3
MRRVLGRSAATWRFGALSVAVALAFAAAACDSPPPDLREWSPDDHDRPTEQPQQQAAPAANARPTSSGDATAELVELAWQRQCTACHGRAGHGDGPQGPMLHASDLTRVDWQDKTSDDQIKATIRKGKEKMPAFDLPDRVIDGLVRRIRANKGK